jgi:hypothetical protein
VKRILIYLQVPPLTPGTNKKVGEALKATYSNWSAKAEEKSIPSDPKRWTMADVKIWIQWTVTEFSLAADWHEELLRELQVSLCRVDI